MARVFNKALMGPPEEEESAYDMLMKQLQEPDPTPAPMFNMDQQAARIRQNNDMVGLGLLGQMSGDESTQNVGGQVFRQALSGRQERVDDRGTFDPLTGKMSESPEYQASQQQQRKAKIFEQALKYEEKNQRAQERVDAAEAARSGREDMVRLAASLRGGVDNELIQLRKDLLTSQIDKTKAATATTTAKVEDKKNKMSESAARSVEKAKLVIDHIDTAMKQAGPFTTGLVGSGLAKIKGTKAYDLRKTIDTVKANIGFEELAAMRQASPTGGALGQVAIQELNFLQNVIANLDADQSHGQAVKNLKKAQEHFRKWQHTMQLASGQGPQLTPTLPPGTGGGIPPAAAGQGGTGAVPGQAPPAGVQAPQGGRTRTLPNGVVIEIIN